MSEPPTSPPSAAPPGLVYRLARLNSLKLSEAFADNGMPDLLPRHALQLLPLLLGGGVRASDLAAKLGVTRQAAAQVVGTLERAGYLTRIDDPGDRRAKLVCLTPRGRMATRVLHRSMRALERDWESVLGPERMTELHRTLTILVNRQG
ncbi:MarR family transcriptional regulator [Nocardia gipuzkoensis]|uniref:MarR family winged helix-turn-helix transcriptional regulator n=1 Tax=Nocardia TaxID=1817 RepID=UPI001E2A0059|nr:MULTISPECIES: MarR family transcriptional regulator [Nocardia]UGT69395.1 MarR family transcriptional regulator [Nocardia gipuzkoensis]